MPRAEILIHDDPDARAVSPDLWGIFLEDINFAIDGGLNAELICNGAFEFTDRDRRDWGPLTGWRISTPVGPRQTWVRTDEPLHPNTATHLRITGPATIRNDGWDPVHVRHRDRYRLQLATRHVEGSGTLTVRIADTRQSLTSAAQLQASQHGWQWHHADLAATTPGRGNLELHIPEGLTIDLDEVSLRPLDEHGAPQLFRPDLLHALADLRPSFVRFPGGCVAHGHGLDNIYHWKTTVGHPHERRRMPNPWGYHQSMNIGYYEYFLLCERLQATPIPVLAAGVCCQNTSGGPRAIPLEQMPDYIQDILDLIEFATGAEHTRWGGLRAQMGHPDPFQLRYLGIGNEDEITGDFQTRYSQIEDAVRQAHPEITVIGTSGPAPFGRDFDRGWELARARGTAMVDEHFYRTPLWFHENTDRYDHYDRQGPAVYLGEFAAMSNTVRSALAEAAFMIGLERNSDIVKLASYAPLLARIGSTQWQPDLIYFDADQVHLSASYHVQRMFAHNRGARIHDVTYSPPSIPTTPAATTSTITATAGGAHYELTDITVDGTTCHDTTVAGPETGDLGTIDPRNVELELTATRIAGTEGLRIHLGQDNPAPARSVNIGEWQNKSTSVTRRHLGLAELEDGPEIWEGVSTGRPIHIRIAVQDDIVRVWIDGQLRHDYPAPTRPEQRLVVGATSRRSGDHDEYIVKLVNATHRTAPVTLRPQQRRPITANAAMLAGANPDEGQPREPAPSQPQEVTLEPTDVVPLDLPPWSLTVVSITA